MASAISSLDASGSEEEPSSALHVLVVDDDPDSLAALQHAITLLGHPVDGASNGAEAWEKHCAHPAHVIVSDWSMPHMSGVDLCRLVRANADTEYVYFVLMTGFADKAHRLEGMRAGADDYLTKPLDLEELEARLLSARRVISMQRTLSRQNAQLARESDLSFKAARVDTLTESGNRLRLREDLEALLARASRYGHRYSAALCDIDLFKQYNDTYGHLAGDAALRLAASTIASALRQGDALYRYGGEEFLVILPEQSAEEAARVMDRVRDDVEGLAITHRASEVGVLTISVGVAELRVGSDSGSQDEWLQRADAALYRAKRNGRNRVEVDGPRSQAVPSGSQAVPSGTVATSSRARTG